METATENIWTPDNSDGYALVQDMARTADDVDEAFVRQRQIYPIAVNSVAERSAFFPTPVQGNRVWRTDLGVEEAYFGVYNASSNPGGLSAAGWYPIGGFAQSPPNRLVLRFRRSDGTLGLNDNADTLLRWESVSVNTLGATATVGGSGGVVTGLRPGVYKVTVEALIALANTSWATASIHFTGSAPTVLGASRAEVQAPPGFNSILLVTEVYIPDTSTSMSVRLFTSTGGNVLRADGTLTMVRSPYA